MAELDTVLIISPHFDDAIFSLGGAILDGYFKELSVLTVFPRSRYSLANIEKKIVSKVRMEEERKVMSLIGARMYFFSYSDASIRFRDKENDYMNIEIDFRGNLLAIGILRKIKAFLRKHTYSYYLFPLGFGQVDHVILRRIGIQFYLSGLPVIFYEDGSYDITTNRKNILDFVNSFPIPLEPYHLQFNNIQKKIKVINQYKSQINQQILRNICNAYELVQGEVIWLPKGQKNS